MVSTQPIPALGQDGYSAQVADSYVIRPADVLDVAVFREADLSATGLIVSPNGAISLPLVGPVEVAGLSPAEVEGRLESILGTRYLQNPNVSVNVVNYGSHLVTVEGSVSNPGVYQFVPGTKLSGALALGGGLTRVAASEEVAIFRTTETGIEVAKFDYGAVVAGTMLDPVLRPSDRVVVGTDGLSQFWQDALRAMPVFGLFVTATR